MTTKALFVRLEAKPGKENEVAKFLRDGQGLVQQEPATTAWFGIKLGPTTFAIFDAFPDDAGRDAHLSGKVAKTLMEKAPELLAQPPKIEKADVSGRQITGVKSLSVTCDTAPALCSLQSPIDIRQFVVRGA
jgi:quinol monooxygenase YgiN